MPGTGHFQPEADPTIAQRPDAEKCHRSKPLRRNAMDDDGCRIVAPGLYRPARTPVTMSELQLKPKRLKRAVRQLSRGGKFRFTLRNLYYKLVRTGDWPQPQQDPLDTLDRFKDALQAYEDQHGPVPGRIRNVDRLSEMDLATLPPDVADYTTRRVLVCDRQEVFLSFIFIKKI